MANQRIGLFGGTFDPIHLGHLIAAVEFRSALHLDEVWFLPAASPPHKPGMPITAIADRCRMVQLAIAGTPRFSVNMIDAERAGPSYTVDLLKLLREEYPETSFIFLMGADSLRDIPTWREPGEIIRMAEIGVALRPGIELDVASILRTIDANPTRIHLVTMPEIGISSTDIRTRVAGGKPITFQVPATVERYIRYNQLYRGNHLQSPPAGPRD